MGDERGAFWYGRLKLAFSQALFTYNASIRVWLLVFLRRGTALQREKTKTAVFQEERFDVFDLLGYFKVHALRVYGYLPGYDQNEVWYDQTKQVWYSGTPEYKLEYPTTHTLAVIGCVDVCCFGAAK